MNKLSIACWTLLLALATTGCPKGNGSGDDDDDSTPSGPTDVDGDGKPDLVVLSAPPGSWNIFVYSDGANLDPAAAPDITIGPGGGYAQDISTCDVDGDAQVDIVIAENDRVSIFLGSKQVQWQTALPQVVVDQVGAYELACADVTGDGYDDIVSDMSASQGLTVIEGGTDLESLSYQPLTDFAHITLSDAVNDPNVDDWTLGDLDNDGVLDIVAVSQGSTAAPYGTMAIHLGGALADGPLFPGAITIPAPTAGSTHMAVADIDGDGARDIVRINDTTLEVFGGPEVAAGTITPGLTIAGFTETDAVLAMYPLPFGSIPHEIMLSTNYGVYQTAFQATALAPGGIPGLDVCSKHSPTDTERVAQNAVSALDQTRIYVGSDPAHGEDGDQIEVDGSVVGDCDNLCTVSADYFCSFFIDGTVDPTPNPNITYVNSFADDPITDL